MKKVLIIDDSSTIRKLVSKCVTTVGGEIVGQAEDGEEGLEKFRELSPDIVLLDVTMPNKDGRQCLREILQYNPDAFVIMLSSINSQDVVSECLDIGAKAFLNKFGNIEPLVLEGELRKFFSGSFDVKASGGGL